MNGKKIAISGIVGGIWLLIMTFVANFIAVLIAPYDIAILGGMRPMDDPIMFLFFAYPFVFSFAAACVFAAINSALQGAMTKAGIMYGLMLFVLVTIPNQFVIYASMTYPLGFYLSNILTGLIGFPVLGVILAAVQERFS